MNKQRPVVNDSVPIDPLLVAANYFSLDCLDMTFQLLRNRQPCLALEVQNSIAKARLEQSHNHQDKQVALDIALAQVSEIVAALSDIAETAALDPSQSKSSLLEIHQTLLEWLLYAQSFLIDDNLPGKQL